MEKSCGNCAKGMGRPRSCGDSYMCQDFGMWVPEEAEPGAGAQQTGFERGCDSCIKYKNNEYKFSCIECSPKNYYKHWVPVKNCGNCGYNTGLGCDNELPCNIDHSGWIPKEEKPSIGVQQKGLHGKKFDQGKPDLSLLKYLPNALTAVGAVMTGGARKYARGDFLYVPDAQNRYNAALLRHWLENPAGIVEDMKEFGVNVTHDMAVAVNALFALEIRLRAEKEASDEN